MPQARSVWNYPEAFWDLCESAANKGELSAQILDTKEALSIRARFYGFKAAVKREHKKEQMVRAREGAAPMDARTQRLYDLASRIDSVVCWTETTPTSGKTQVTFMHRDSTKLANVLKGFKVTGVTEVRVDMDESARRVLQQLIEKGKDKNYG